MNSLTIFDHLWVCRVFWHSHSCLATLNSGQVCHPRFNFTTLNVHMTFCNSIHAKKCTKSKYCVITDQRSMIIGLFKMQSKRSHLITGQYRLTCLQVSQSSRRVFHQFTFSRLVNKNGLSEFEHKKPKPQDQLSHTTLLLEQHKIPIRG